MQGPTDSNWGGPVSDTGATESETIINTLQTEAEEAPRLTNPVRGDPTIELHKWHWLGTKCRHNGKEMDRWQNLNEFWYKVNENRN